MKEDSSKNHGVEKSIALSHQIQSLFPFRKQKECFWNQWENDSETEKKTSKKWWKRIT